MIYMLSLFLLFAVAVLLCRTGISAIGDESELDSE